MAFFLRPDEEPLRNTINKIGEKWPPWGVPDGTNIKLDEKQRSFDIYPVLNRFAYGKSEYKYYILTR